MSIRSIYLSDFTVFLLIFCVDILAIVENEVLKSSTIIALPATSPFRYVNVCFICSPAQLLNAYIFTIVITY
jgi:hypothetical protein